MFVKICENHFCIYWEDNQCVLKSISLDIQGICQDCIYVELEQFTMDNAREQMRKKFERMYGNWDKIDL